MSDSSSPLARLRRVRERFDDDTSRAIFDARVRHLLTGDFAPFADLVDSGLVPVHDDFSWREFRRTLEDHARSRRIVIYGAGGEGDQLLWVLRTTSAVDPVAYCDRNTHLTKALPVLSPEEAVAEYVRRRDVTFVLGSEMYHAQMRANLLRLGVDPQHILGGSGVVERQYFDGDVVTLRPHEVFVDGGALDLATSRHLLDLQSRSGHTASCIAFEPDPNNVARIGSDIDDRITVVPLGLWSSRTTLRFSATSNGSSRVADNGTHEVPVCDLDSYLDGAPATFIKLDIEGAELEALHGAINTLRTHHPTVAASVYHRISDLPAIPELLSTHLPDHRWSIRHYSIFPAETVLYATPPPPPTGSPYTSTLRACADQEGPRP